MKVTLGFLHKMNYSHIINFFELKVRGCGQSSNILVMFLFFLLCPCMSCRVKGKHFQRSTEQQINTSQTRSIRSLEKHRPVLPGITEHHQNYWEMLLWIDIIWKWSLQKAHSENPFKLVTSSSSHICSPCSGLNSPGSFPGILVMA